jgi:hypothetical protein
LRFRERFAFLGAKKKGGAIARAALSGDEG